MKRMTIFLLVMMLLLAPSAFTEDEKNIDFLALEHTMSIEAILKTHESVRTDHVYYDDLGMELFSTCMLAKNDENGEMRLMYCDSEGNTEILSSGMGVGFDAWSMQKYISAFILDEYSATVSEMEKGFFRSVQPNEKLYEVKYDGDTVIIATRTPVSDAEEDGCIHVEYALNAESMLLEEYKEYYLPYEGEKELSAWGKVSYDTADQTEEDLFALMNAEETRLVNVVLNPGSDDEQMFSFSAPKNVDLQLVYPEEYMLYEDAAGKRMYAGAYADEAGNYPDELTLYLIRLG